MKKQNISVLTTVFNGEKHIQQAVESILNQSFDDFEYVIVNDGSTDGTLNYLKSISDPRLNIINIPNSGRGIALNTGLESCSSNYVVILDADDVSSKFRLEIQYQYMEDHPETALLAANCVVDDKDILKAPAKEINVQPICKTALIKRNPICHSSVIIRSSVFRELGGYNTTRDVLFDYDLWIRMASANHFFSAVNLPLVFKRIHSGQNFERKRRVYYLWEATKLKLKAKKYFSNNTFDYFYIMGAFVYGLMPLFLRKKLMGKI